MSTPKIFISHSSKDKQIIDAFVEFLIRAGIPEEDILSSSTPGTHLRTGVSLYESLRNILDSENVFVLLFLSDNYYSSPVCLNEMGAAWVKQAKWFYILLPGFSFGQIKGVIKQNEIVGISLSSIDKMTRERFYDLKNELEKWFRIKLRANVWERARDNFFECVGNYNISTNMPLSMKHVRSYCIGDLENDGCRIITAESSETKTTVSVNFALTDTKLCSIVYFTEYKNWKAFSDVDKRLCFDISSNSTMMHAEIEIALGDTDEKCDIVVGENPISYHIPLTQFSSSGAAWENTKEVKFLFRRKDILAPVKVVIENLRLE